MKSLRSSLSASPVLMPLPSQVSCLFCVFGRIRPTTSFTLTIHIATHTQKKSSNSKKNVELTCFCFYSMAFKPLSFSYRQSCKVTLTPTRKISQQEAYDSIHNVLEVGFIEVSRTVWFGEAWKNEECVCKRERWSYFCMWHPVQESMMLRRSPLKEAVSVHVSSTLSTVPYGSIISLNIFQTYSRRVEKRNVRNECEIYAKDCQRM